MGTAGLAPRFFQTDFGPAHPSESGADRPATFHSHNCRTTALGGPARVCP